MDAETKALVERLRCRLDDDDEWKAAEAIERQYASGFAAGIEAAAARAYQWARPQELRLRCGEMTAQEMRTALAVARGIAATIRHIRALAPQDGGHQP